MFHVEHMLRILVLVFRGIGLESYVLRETWEEGLMPADFCNLKLVFAEKFTRHSEGGVLA
jgi:hypothetical protein